jgi:mono/diheme cytochrome c family protein
LVEFLGHFQPSAQSMTLRVLVTNPIGTPTAGRGISILAVASLLTPLVGQGVQALDGDSLALRAQRVFAANCVRCHGGERRRSDVDLVRHKGLDKNHRVVPGDPLASKLYQAITHGTATAMPPKQPRLSEADIAIVREWIEQGAKPAASVANATPFRSTPMRIQDADRAYWAFQPLHRPAVPSPSGDTWSRNSIDKFILARLQNSGLQPNAPASKQTLIRRMSYGVCGLPPTQGELADLDLRKAADHFLSDSAYGERWGRHWLDVARFGESTGYEADQDRRHAYKYRDAVIKALNDDLPYDEFVGWQIAGDELQPNEARAIALTGFLAAGPSITNEGGDRVKYAKLDDVVSTTGSAFLGLTVGCARCHDHKYDPISQRDYYEMVGVFVSCREQDVPLTPEAREQRKKLESEVRAANKAFSTWRNTMREKVRQDRIQDLPLSSEEKSMLAAKRDRKNKQQQDLLVKFNKKLKVSDRDMMGVLNDAQRAEMTQLKDDQGQWNKKLKATDQFLGRVMVEGGRRSADNYLLGRGDFRNKTEKIGFGFLDVLTRSENGLDQWFETPPSDARTPWRRRALAKWLTDVDRGAGALVARVIVNRMWHHHFGLGIVRTSGNFGITGDDPSHPELLEWLACELIDHDWSLKHVHRLLLDSAVYRQGSAVNEAGIRKDPDNRLWWRRRPLRIEAEVWRDSVLAVCGTLNREMYGPSIKPWVPTDAISTGSTRKWPTNVKDGPATWRRSIYIYTKRSMLMPMLESLDLPDSTLSCSVRNQTTTPPAALLMMNNEFIRDQAKRLAVKAYSACSQDADRIAWLYKEALGRRPDSNEVTQAKRFLAIQGGDPKQGKATGKSGLPASAFVNYCQVILSLNEFLYVD